MNTLHFNPFARHARLSSTLLLSVQAWCLLVSPETTCLALADEPAWRIVSPVDQTVFRRIVTGMVVSIEKPTGVIGRLRCTNWESGRGEIRAVPIGASSIEHVAVSLGGAPFPDGMYRFQVLSEAEPERVMAEISIEIAVDPTWIPDLPTIDFPLLETQFPEGTSRISLAGLAGGKIWGLVRRDGVDLVGFHASPDQGAFWVHELNWSFGSGRFEASVYAGDPAHLTLQPESSTSFLIGNEPPITDQDDRWDHPVMPKIGDGPIVPYTTVPAPWGATVPASGQEGG